jgi:ATP adenylyltransferase
MRYLWSPWRMDYILEKKPKGCIFCMKPMERRDKENLILHRGKYAFVIMNRFPYNSGHLMVVPNRHSLDLKQLDDKEFRELTDLLKVSVEILKSSLHPDGFNMGMNIGKAGGAGEEHIHFHIVPRWVGDTNFMPVFGETKVIPEYLQETYQKLQSAFRDFLRGDEAGKGGRKR